MFTTPSRRAVLSSAVLVSLLAGLPLAHAADPGVEKDTLRIGSFLPLQSALAAGATQYRAGADAYFKSVNDAGGVHGRKIDWVVENDSYNPQQAVAVTKKMIDRDGVFAIVSTLGTATGLAVLPLLEQRKVPGINLSGASPLLSEPKAKNLFGLTPSGVAQGRSIASYATGPFAGKKIGVFYQNDQLGKDMRDGVVAELKGQGITPAAEATYVPSDVDVSAQALSLKQSGAEVVIMAAIPKQGSLFLQEMTKLGWAPKVVAGTMMSDPITPSLAGKALEGTVIGIITAVPTTPNPKLQAVNATIRKYHPEVDPGYWSYLGYAGAAVFVEAARKAGPDISREKLVSTLETMKDIDVAVMPPLSFSPDNHSGSKTLDYAIWKDGVLTPIPASR